MANVTVDELKTNAPSSFAASLQSNSTFESYTKDGGTTMVIEDVREGAEMFRTTKEKESVQSLPPPSNSGMVKESQTDSTMNPELKSTNSDKTVTTEKVALNFTTLTTLDKSQKTSTTPVPLRSVMRSELLASGTSESFQKRKTTSSIFRHLSLSTGLTSSERFSSQKLLKRSTTNSLTELTTTKSISTVKGTTGKQFVTKSKEDSSDLNKPNKTTKFVSRSTTQKATSQSMSSRHRLPLIKDAFLKTTVMPSTINKSVAIPSHRRVESSTSQSSVTDFYSETTTMEPVQAMGAGALVIVVLLPFLALFLIAVITALRRKMKKSSRRRQRNSNQNAHKKVDKDQAQMVPLTKNDSID